MFILPGVICPPVYLGEFSFFSYFYGTRLYWLKGNDRLPNVIQEPSDSTLTLRPEFPR